MTVCATAEQAIETVVAERPDLLLADLGMPRCDGYEMIRRIRALPGYQTPALPAVALTAYGGAQDRERAFAAGFQERVAKPISPDALVAVLARVAGRAASPQRG